jgi:hypothetical protein
MCKCPVSQQHDRKASDHSEQGSTSKMPKKDKGHHKMKAAYNSKDKEAKTFFLKTAKYVPQEHSSISMK